MNGECPGWMSFVEITGQLVLIAMAVELVDWQIVQITTAIFIFLSLDIFNLFVFYIVLVL